MNDSEIVTARLVDDLVQSASDAVMEISGAQLGVGLTEIVVEGTSKVLFSSEHTRWKYIVESDVVAINGDRSPVCQGRVVTFIDLTLAGALKHFNDFSPGTSVILAFNVFPQRFHPCLELVGTGVVALSTRVSRGGACYNSSSVRVAECYLSGLDRVIGEVCCVSGRYMPVSPSRNGMVSPLVRVPSRNRHV